MKKFWRSTAMTVLLFLLAAGFLSVGVVGGTRAALQNPSEYFVSSIDMKHIGVTLLENGEEVSKRDYGDAAGAGFDETKVSGKLVLKDLGDDKEIKLGKQYDFAVAVKNTGSINQYVRVTLRKYWVKDVSEAGVKGWFNGAGDKIINDIYQPEYIQLSYDGESYNKSNWIWDEAAHTSERDVYYYNGILAPNQISESLVKTISISPDVTKNAVLTVTEEGGKTVYTYAYDGYGFVVEAEVDAVQTHNKDAAITSAWGSYSMASTLPDPPAT